MPELPEVETVVSLLNTLITDRVFKDVHIYWDNIIAHPSVHEFSTKIEGESIESLERRGKYIIFNLTNYTLVSHLRMEGKYYVHDEITDRSKHSHVVFNFVDGGQLHYHDTRKFGKMYLYEKEQPLEILENIGYEPWSEKLTGKSLKALAKTRRIPIKTFLLDQSVIAGIGNIYANEILFAARIHPETRCYKITIKQFDEIIKHTQRILADAIDAGGTTIRSYTSSLGVTGLFQQSLMVHNREKELCFVCNSEIVKKMVTQRGTYICPTCQIRK